jgi:cation diffusion facilitator CzcD-associated flavoprotein CzcO
MTKNSHSIIIIGTGFAGIGMAIKLLKQGNTNFIIAERSATIGGTWRDNTYPGAACDISSHLYSFSFEQNPNWSRMFADQWEILEYTKHCITKYGLEKYVRLNTEVTGGSFDEISGMWTLNLKDGDTLTSNIVINALGPLNRPQIPNIPGLADFKGRVFHSSEWDHTFDYKGKKVAVVGTGASAVQIVPAIAKDVEHLTVFQRSAPWVIPKADRPMKEWEKKMFHILPFTQRMLRWKWYWQNELIGTLIFTRPRANQMVQNMVLKFINKKIKDPVLREKLIPDYTMGCKRITPSKEYYPALLRPNVDLVNAGINKVEGNTVFTADGKQYEADAIVLATGFKAADAPVDFVVKGRGGRILAEDWKEGPEAYYGSTVTGYPNLFFLIGPNTGLGHNSMIFVIESQVNYVLDGIKNLEKRKAKFMDVKPEAQKVYNDVLQEKLKHTVWATGCRSWYIAANGRNTTVWPQLTYTMWFKMKHIKAKDYEFVK